MLYTEVAVRTDAPYRHAFTYSVPSGLDLTPGQGVLVPFGRRVLQGVVLSLGPTSNFEGEIRPILDIATEIPLLPPHLIGLARWIAERYFAPLFPCLALLLPPGVERRTRVRLTPVDGVSPATEARGLILEALRLDPAASIPALRRTLRLPRLAATLDSMAREGLLRREYSLDPPSTRPKTVRSARVTERAEQAGGAGPIVRRLQEAGGNAPLAWLHRLPEWSEADFRSLVDGGLVEETEVRVYRDPLAGDEFPVRSAPALSPAQAAAVAQILDPAASQRPCLLHGVTGSGKTEVYLAAAAATLADHRQVIILVPEISLTPQTVERVAGRFPGRVAVLHSALPDGQRYDQWCGIREGHFDVVVGSRSAIFAPLERLGLIVIDEEHEWTYKQQDRQPRYQTRDVAVRLAATTNASLVLGSATPDVVSYSRAVHLRYQLVALPERVRPVEGGAGEEQSSLPRVEVVDLATELRAGNRSIFSRSLVEALQDCLDHEEQALLFLNRRGSASFLLCRDCGHVPRCARCAVSLTYHADGDRLICHLCARQRRSPSTCPRCGSLRIRRLGLGTERVVEELASRFPAARVVRWDRDSARKAADHEQIFRSLQKGTADIVVGTQMVAKGLDLPKLTLVGIVNADLSLNLPEYYSGERSFQLLTQVAGRAGRRERPGRVILQTYAPNHYAVRAAAAHDYAAFFRQEIEYRRRASYPPFARLTRLVFAHGSAHSAEAEAKRLAGDLHRLIDAGEVSGASVVGPAPCRTPRLRGRWRWQLLIRASQPLQLLDRLRLPVGWSVDVDPESFA